MIATLYHKSSINQFLVGSFLLICVWTNIDSLLAIIPNGEDYVSGKYVVLFIGLAKLFDMSMGINGAIIQQSEHYRLNFYTMGILAILGITTNLLLIPKLGINGAAIASLISIGIANILRVIIIKRKFSLSPFRMNSIIAAAIVITTYFAVSLLPTLPSPLLDILFKGSITFCLFLGLTYMLKVSEDVNTLIIALRRKLSK